jgi:hypothetical protein
MAIKRTLMDFSNKDWQTSTVKLTQAGNGILSGTFPIFWPLTADGKFGASISTPVTGYEWVFSDGQVATTTQLIGLIRSGFTVNTAGPIDTQNSTRNLQVLNTSTVGLVQLNVVQEDLPWSDSRHPIEERLDKLFETFGGVQTALERLTTRVEALEATVNP